jgi:hypothetical protein
MRFRPHAGPDIDFKKFPSQLNQDYDTPPRMSVHAFDGAKAASPFGVKDLIGNVR